MKDLDPMIHTPSRLRVMATLAALPQRSSITFLRLQEILEMTPGNLSTHLRKLEEAGYLNQHKIIERRHPVTFIEPTRAGLAAFDTYRDTIRGYLDSADPGSEPVSEEEITDVHSDS